MLKAKILLLALPLASATGFAPLGTEAAAPLAEGEFTQTQLTALQSFLNGSYQLDSHLAQSQLAGMDVHIIDEVGPTERYNAIYMKEGETEELLGANSFGTGEDGNAVSYTIGLANDVESTPVYTYDASGELTPIPFEEAYAQPLTYLADVSLEQFERHFEVTATGTGYALVPDQAAMGYLTEGFTRFFPATAAGNWDAATYDNGLYSLTLNTDAEGVPTSMDFVTYSADRFGIVTEEYHTALKAVDQVRGVLLFDDRTDEPAQALAKAIDQLGTQLATGNFTQTIDIDGTLTYHNYYDLNNTLSNLPGGLMMTDNNTLQDATYGTTYTGIAQTRGEDGNLGYNLIAVSPDADYSANLDATIYSLEDVIPQLGSLSEDFFNYDAATATYTFDLTDPRVSSDDFAVSILRALFGYGDGQSARVPTYCDDATSYTYDFHDLEITLDEAGNFAEATLHFASAMVGNENAATTVSFSDFGTTDLSSIESIEAPLATLLGTSN